MEKEEINWYSKTTEETLKHFETSKQGLTTSDAKFRLEKYGKNEFKKEKKESQILAFLKQFNSPLIYILIIAMIISFTFNHLVDGYVILTVLVLNACIGYFQNRKAERAIDALKKMIVSYAKVYRDKELIKIPAYELVPGDVIYLEEGDKVPADCRLIEIKNLRTQESSLTGESLPVDKKLEILFDKTPLGDRDNMVFMSTLVVAGSGNAIVVNTASSTEIGKIAESIQKVKPTPSLFQRKTKRLAIILGIFAVIGASLTFLIGFFYRDLEFIDIFFFTVASLVSGIPEGLPAVLSIVLAVGAWRMAKRNAIVRHLSSVETLGSIDVIVTDKTGTLTKNTLTIEKIYTHEGEFSVTGSGWQPLGRFYKNKELIHPLKFKSLEKIFSISTLCNKSNLLRKDGDYEIVGDPTEVSLLVLSKKAGVERHEFIEQKRQNILDDFPFNSTLKLRASLIEIEKRKKQLYTIGAFEEINGKSSYYFDDKNINLDNKLKKELLKKAEKLASEGYRVLALAYKDVPLTVNSITENIIKDLIFVGFVGMKDPPREEVKEAIVKARSAGIRIIMNTGDHKDTAIAIAKEIGLIKSNQISSKTVFTESELNEFSNEQFYNAVKNAIIFARITPDMKLRIVEALQKQGHIVAMTGDGVNDAPALKKSDVGISMGIIGTDVARESSEFVLADDNFASIINAVEEGRVVFRNVRNASTYLVSTNIAEYITIITSLLVGLPLPLLPIHLLWMNLLTDGFNGVSLSFEKSHHTALSGPPLPKKEHILNNEAIPFLIIVGIVMAIFTLSFFIYFNNQFGINKAMTAAFISMTMCQLFNVFNMRSLHKSIFEIGFLSNKYVLAALSTSFGFMLVLIYTPIIQNFFRFETLTFIEITMIFLSSSIVLISGEAYKRIRFGKWK